jgi:hypothetical protein
MKKITLKTAIMKQLKTNIITAITAVFLFLPSFGGAGGGWGLHAQIPGTPYIVPSHYGEITCAQTTEGREFWLTFGPNEIQPGSGPLNAPPINMGLYLTIATKYNTDVTLTFNRIQADNPAAPPAAYSATYHVEAGTTERIDLSNIQGEVAPYNANLGDMREYVVMVDWAPPAPPVPPSTLATAYYLNSGVYNRTLHITSTMPISAYAFNTGKNTTDATLLLPVSNWGNDYYRLSYRPFPYTAYDPVLLPSLYSGIDHEFIVAKEDGTELFLNGASTPFAVINEGEVYYNRGLASTDTTGRHITSGKPVGYFVHSAIAQIPIGRTAADILLEQFPPVDQWGTRFLVPSAPPGFFSNQFPFPVQNRIRIMASQNQTKVTFPGATAQNMAGSSLGSFLTSGGVANGGGGFLNAGQWIEILINGPVVVPPGDPGSCYIEADKPIEVAAYMQGGGLPTVSGDEPVGDPSIANIPSLEQTATEIVISPFLFFPLQADVTVFSPDPYPDTFMDLVNSVHYMIIVTATETKNQTVVTIDNATISLDPLLWRDNAASGATGGTAFSYYLYVFDNTAHYGKSFDIKNPSGVIIFAVGAAYDESYYYNAGSGSCIIN